MQSVHLRSVCVLSYRLTQLLVLLSAGLGWQGTTNLPFSSLGSICSGIINDNYADVNAAGVIMMNLVIGLAFFAIMMVALYIWRGRKPFITELEEGETLQISGDEEVHLNRNQKFCPDGTFYYRYYPSDPFDDSVDCPQPRDQVPVLAFRCEALLPDWITDSLCWKMCRLWQYPEKPHELGHDCYADGCLYTAV